MSTGKVSQGKDPGALNRMGPYPDKDTAERALQIAAERTKRRTRQTTSEQLTLRHARGCNA